MRQRDDLSGMIVNGFEAQSRESSKKRSVSRIDWSIYRNYDMSSLSAKQRRIMLKKIEGLSNKEIGEIEGISAKSVSAYLDLAKRKIEGNPRPVNAEYRKLYMRNYTKTHDLPKPNRQYQNIDNDIIKMGVSYIAYIWVKKAKKSVYLKCSTDYDTVNNIRNIARKHLDDGTFDEWIVQFRKNGRKITEEDQDYLSQR